MVEQIRDRGREAAVQGPGRTLRTAEAATLAMMELLWGIKRVFKREAWNSTTKGRQEGECKGKILDSIVVHGRDTTRGHYRLPPEAKVNHRSLEKGRKLKAGRKDREHAEAAEHALKSWSAGKTGPMRRAAGPVHGCPKTLREWLKVLHGYGGDSTREASREGMPCMLKGGGRVARRASAVLCRACNDRIPKVGRW